MWFEMMSCPPEMRAANKIRNKKEEGFYYAYLHTDGFTLVLPDVPFQFSKNDVLYSSK